MSAAIDRLAAAVALHRVPDIFSSNVLFVSILSLLILSLYFFHSYILLREIPGPVLAAFSNLPRVSWILSKQAHDIHIDLHRKYGKLVRFGPNMVSVGDSAEIPTLYGFTGKFKKVRNGSASNIQGRRSDLSDYHPLLVRLLPCHRILRQRQTGTDHLHDAGRGYASNAQATDCGHLHNEQPHVL